MAQAQIPGHNPTRDYPMLRAFTNCPLCGGHKSAGLLACWPCFNKHDVARGPHTNGNYWAEARFARAEANLMTAELFAAKYPAVATAMARA